MKDKLVIEFDNGYRIRWEVWNDYFGEDLGSTLGSESLSRIRSIRKKVAAGKHLQSPDYDHFTATAALAEDAKTLETQKDDFGFYWDTKAKAQQALRRAKVAIREANMLRKQHKAKTPWPDWAIKAKAAGWEPPKNWMP
jgi:hypothetical protein